MPDRDEAGQPQRGGRSRDGCCGRALMAIGMDQVAAHEQELLAYAGAAAGNSRRHHLWREQSGQAAREKVGVIPFNLAGVSHFKLAAILGYAGGIGVRSGCFCVPIPTSYTC